MDIRYFIFLVIPLLLTSCSPPWERVLILENNTDEMLKFTAHKRPNIVTAIHVIREEILSSNQIEIFRHVEYGSGISIGPMSDFDSIILERKNGDRIKWIRPNNNDGIISEKLNIGKDRDIPKDIYNDKFWSYNTSGHYQELVFIINTEDLKLFE